MFPESYFSPNLSLNTSFSKKSGSLSQCIFILLRSKNRNKSLFLFSCGIATLFEFWNVKCPMFTFLWSTCIVEKFLKTEKCNLQKQGYFKMTNKLQYVGSYQHAAEIWIAHVICNESSTQTNSEGKKKSKRIEWGNHRN